MPEIVASGTAPRDPRGNGGAAGTYNNVPSVNVAPIQVAGLTPLYDCTATECRSLPEKYCCSRLNVFGGSGLEIESNRAPGYENDWSTFLIDFGLYSNNSGAVTVAVILEKCVGADTWETSATLTGSITYGYYIAPGSMSNHPTYFGYLLNWARVLALKGAGVYRIKFTTAMRELSGCLVSAEFNVRKFTCEWAHGTVKFETLLRGKIGDPNHQGRVFDLCGINTNIFFQKWNGWYDSMRVPGFFGYEKIKEYTEVLLEYQNGQIERIKDEAIQAWEFHSNYMDKEIHDRLKVFAFMADEVFVSDYNINNSDYNINRLKAMRDGAYEPVYQDKLRRRISKVTVPFKSQVQHIIKSLCCPPKG